MCCDLKGHGNEINLKFSYGESVRMAGRATGDERGSVCCDLKGHGNEINLKFSYGESVRSLDLCVMIWNFSSLILAYLYN